MRVKYVLMQNESNHQGFKEDKRIEELGKKRLNELDPMYQFQFPFPIHVSLEVPYL